MFYTIFQNNRVNFVTLFATILLLLKLVYSFVSEK